MPRPGDGCRRRHAACARVGGGRRQGQLLGRFAFDEVDVDERSADGEDDDHHDGGHQPTDPPVAPAGLGGAHTGQSGVTRRSSCSGARRGSRRPAPMASVHSSDWTTREVVLWPANSCWRWAAVTLPRVRSRTALMTVRHRLVVGEGPQPAGHGRGGHEGAAGEGEGEDDREGGGVDRLGAAGVQPDQREEERRGQGEGQQHGEAEQQAGDAVGPEADGQADQRR